MKVLPKVPRWQLGPRLALGAGSGARSPSPPPRDVPAAGVCTPHQLILSPHPAGYEETLTRLAAILAKHFADTRIVGTGEALDRGLGPYLGHKRKLFIFLVSVDAKICHKILAS